MTFISDRDSKTRKSRKRQQQLHRQNWTKLYNTILLLHWTHTQRKKRRTA